MRKKIIIFLLMPLFSFAQINEGMPEENINPIPSYQEGHNKVSKTTYENIKIKGVRLETLQLFKGEAPALGNLFNMPFSVSIPDPDARNFFNRDIKLVFGEATANWELYYIEILSSNIPLRILEKDVKLGNDISTLGLGNNLKYIPGEGNKRSAVFMTEYDNSFLAIEYDCSTNKITKIEYVSPT